MNIVLNIKEVSTMCRVMDHTHTHTLTDKCPKKCEPKDSWEMKKIERKKEKNATQISMKSVAKKCQNHQRFLFGKTPHTTHCVALALAQSLVLFLCIFLGLPFARTIYSVRFSAGDFYTWG